MEQRSWLKKECGRWTLQAGWSTTDGVGVVRDPCIDISAPWGGGVPVDKVPPLTLLHLFLNPLRLMLLPPTGIGRDGRNRKKW